MAGKTQSKLTPSMYHEKAKVRRPGVVAKTKSSHLKTSKNYVKAYRGQGR